jgi:small-conductance mechanosensitive channel
MKSHQRIFLVVLFAVLALTVAGLLLTRDSGSRVTSVANRSSDAAQPPVDVRPLQTAQGLAPLATGRDEQALAREAIRLGDHELDIAFTDAMNEVASQPLPSNSEIRAIQERIAAAQKQVTDGNAEVAGLTKRLAAAGSNEKTGLAQQLELTKAQQDLNQDELDDANEDLARAGGDPKARIQHMVDAHNAVTHDVGGQPDTSMIGSQSSSRVSASNSLLARARAWNVVRSDLARLRQAQQESSAAGTALTSQHNDLERQITDARSTKQAAPKSANVAANSSAAGSSSKPEETDAALSSLRARATAQKRIANLDRRIRDEQDLASNYGQWNALVAARQRTLLHGLFLSLLWMLFIVLAVFVFNRSMDRFFDRLEPEMKRLLTLRAVVRVTARAAGAVLILLVIFGPPGQMATVLALAGAGLTVALKDFIVGFFGWFVLMGKNGIRHGDWVEINGVSGEVVEIGLFHTILLETGNWNDSGHPTGRRVAFVNSYAIEGHYFNFSTSGQWLWDELQIAVPADQDPYPIVAEIQKIVTKETEANVRLAEQEWGRLGNVERTHAFSAGPAISVRPANLGFEISVRYVTRANERHQQRAKLYLDIVELLRRKNIPQPAQLPATSPAAETA